MGARPCGVKLIRRCERDVGAYVLRVNGWGSNVFAFVTDDHRHGRWDRRTGDVAWDSNPMHWWSCSVLFGPDAVDRSLWGLVDGDGRWRAVEWGKGQPIPGLG